MYEKTLNEFLPIDLGELRKPGFIQMMLDQRDEQIKRVESKGGFRKQETCPITGSSEVSTFCKINDLLYRLKKKFKRFTIKCIFSTIKFCSI